MRAIILSAGQGTRLRPLTFLRPKALFPLANRSNISWIIDLLRSYGFNELVINLHHLPDKITESLGDGSSQEVKINYSYEKVIQGTAGCLRQAQDYLQDGDFLIVNSDVATNIDLSSLVEFHQKKKSLFTMVLTHHPSTPIYSLIGLKANGEVASLPPDPPLPGIRPGMHTGVAVTSPSIMQYIPQGYFSLLDLLKRLMEVGEPIYGQVTSNYCLDIGTFGSYQKAHLDVLGGRLKLGLPGQLIQEGIWSGEGTEIDPAARLIPPVLLGQGCQIKSGARLGPFVVVGDGCLIGKGVRIERAILWENVCLNNFCYLKDCVVPNDLTVAAGAILDKCILYR